MSITWILYLVWAHELSGSKALIANFFLITGTSMEVICLIQLNKKISRKLLVQIVIINVLAILSFAFFLEYAIVRIYIVSISVASMFLYLFVFLFLKQRVSIIQRTLGFIALIFALSNIARAVVISISDHEISLVTITPVQTATAFLWITVSFTFPIFYLLILKEKDNQKLHEYRENLESKVRLRTEELEESLRREKELGILKTNFVSMASHEFRTPLTVINSITDVIQKYNNNLSKEEIDERLNKIKSEIKGMTTMLEDFLTIGKSNSQKFQFNPVLFNFSEHLNTIISEYQLSDSIVRTISISQPENDEIILKADPKWIKHIVTNLLSNAIKFSKEDQPIEITVTSKKDEVIFSLKDYGIGIPKEDLKHLFEPFYRAKNVKNISGTGLGLAIIHKGIELHGGSIDIQSEIGVGSTFTITIPQ